MNRTRRFLSIWLALLMCLSALAPAALADAEPAPEDEAAEELIADEAGEAAPDELPEEGLSTDEAEPGETQDEAVSEDDPFEAEDGEAATAAEDETEPSVQDGGEAPAIELTLTEPTETYAPGGEDDNDELFAGYVEAVTGAALPSAVDSPVLDGAKKNTGASLTGVTKAVYDSLSGEIRQVAAGTRTSTQFYIPETELGLPRLTWTAEQLGVDSLIAYNESSGRWEITQQTESAFSALVRVDMDKLVGALLADHPYEMYWYDKTMGSSGGGIAYSVASNASGVTLTITSGYTIRFCVAQGYAANAYETNGAGSSVTTAVEGAQRIVARYADVSDYQKLVGYRREICDLTSYNTPAARGGISYGDPWQLIWVFDGNPDTTVVCEGYSKAFQYLCDLTEFAHDITCWCVTGDMDGGGHMWNIVTMDDGKNYLVDITNCDNGTIGYPDLLFLKGCASGDPSNGYYYDCHGLQISYVYDSDMTGMYTEAELTLSASDYLPGTDSFTASATVSGVTLTGAGVVEAQDLGAVEADSVVMLDPRATGVTQEAAAILSEAQAVLIRPEDAEQSCAALLDSLESAGLQNARVMGDADRDGMTMAADMSRLLRFTAGDLALDELTLLALDINGDGVADRLDAEQLAAFIVG